MKGASDILNTFLQENETVLNSFKEVIKSCSEAVAEMIQMLLHSDKCRNEIEDVLIVLESTLPQLENVMRFIEELKLLGTRTFREVYRFRTEALLKIDELYHQEVNMHQDLQNNGEMIVQLNHPLLAAREQILELTEPEQRWFKLMSSLQKQMSELAQMIETLLSRLKICTKTDTSIFGRTI